MNTAVIITVTICATIVLLSLIGSRSNKRQTASLVKSDDPLLAHCSGCGHKEGVATWNGYKYCPVCGALIVRG